ncbi:MAG: hypothetical protein H6577_27795 [Lewinellaceae bacterium]|nr:hypothetical protein [Lewinellaceae bacterium]
MPPFTLANQTSTMLYSRTLEDSKFDYFKSFLSYVVLGDLSYEKLVRPIIKDAHDLSTGEKNFYSINRNTFPVIVYLVEQDKSFFEKINPDNLTQSNYQHILKLVSHQREIAPSHFA